jgi:uncharacterized membrane-anchored protein YhcB (DUF1043 family)
MNDVTKTLKDAGYVLVGMGVIGFQKAQVRRQELTKELSGRTKDLESQLNEVRTQVAKAAETLQERIEPVLGEVESRLTGLEALLPEQVADLLKQTREAAKSRFATV